MLKNVIAFITAIAFAVTLSACAATDSTAGVKPYPKDTCVVTENKLGSMGDPVTLVYEGQQMKFCCKPCIKKFKADPQKYLSKL